MSQENVEVVRLAYDAFAEEGLDRFMEHFTDDVEYRALGVGRTSDRRAPSRKPRSQRAGASPGSAITAGVAGSQWSTAG